MKHLMTYESYARENPLDRKLKRLREKILKWDEDFAKGRVDIEPQSERDGWELDLKNLLLSTVENLSTLDKDVKTSTMSESDEVIEESKVEEAKPNMEYEELYSETDELNKEAFQAITLIVKMGNDLDNDEKINRIEKVIELHGKNLEELSKKMWGDK